MEPRRTPTDSPSRLSDALDRLERLPPAPADDRRARDAERAVRALAAQLGPRYAPSRATLDRYRVYHRAQEPVLARLRELSRDVEALASEGRGLVLYGAVGTGKDHLLAAMLYAAAARGVPCAWASGQELYGRIRDGMDAGSREEDFFRELCRPQVLAISDPIPPSGAPSAWNLSQLYRLLDRRYRLLRSTWVSLNATSAEDADAKLSAPLFDRLRDGAELLPCFWPTFRREVAP